VSAQVQALHDEDLADSGYVWNVSRLWASPAGHPESSCSGLMSEAFTPSGLTFRQRGILGPAAASGLALLLTPTARWRGAGSWGAALERRGRGRGI